MANDVREIIKKYGIRLTKSLGQNFLTDRDVVKRIVDAADITSDDLVIEVGPGAGSMTKELAERAGHVAAVEIDRHLIPALTDILAGYSNVTIVNRDILDTELEEIIPEGWKSGSRPVKVVANLPYYITTPIIMKFLEEDPGIDLMVFMIQKEVAERMAAAPGGKEYGALSVAVQYYAKPELVFTVPPHCFIPQPEVDSAVVRLKVFDSPPVQLLDRDTFFKTVKAAFGQRRKTLVNALSNSGGFNATKDEMRQMLESLGIEEARRGETLSIQQFAQLSNLLFRASR